MQKLMKPAGITAAASEGNEVAVGGDNGTVGDEDIPGAGEIDAISRLGVEHPQAKPAKPANTASLAKTRPITRTPFFLSASVCREDLQQR